MPIQSTTQLARHLGLSRWTVSRALNHHPGIHPRTVERVRRAMQELRFEPDPLARALRGGRTATIGIAIQELENLNLTSKISALQQKFREQHYRGLIEFTLGRAEIEEQVIRHFAAMRVEGVVLIGCRQTARSHGYQLLQASRIPVLSIDPLDQMLPGAIAVDRGKAMALLVDHLYHLGHRKFAALGVDPDIPYGNVRVSALQEAFRQHARSWSRHVKTFLDASRAHLDFEYGEQLAERFIHSHWPATALIALNDRIAFGAMRRLQQSGYAIPRDVSVVGYDNIELAAYCTPSLTTIDAQVDNLIDQAAEMLFAQIRSQTAPQNEPRLVQPRLVIRASTATAPRT